MSANTFFRFGGIVVCVLLTGCGGMSSSPSSGAGGMPDAPVPSAAESSEAPASGDLIRVGDKITIRLTGVPDEGYIIETQIPASGDISVPLIKDHTFQVARRTGSDVSSEIMAAYKSEKIYTSPVITIIVEERFVSINGDVRTPMRVIYTPDLTLTGAISAAGGFTEYAKRGEVRILRGKQRIQVDANAAAKNPGSDPPLLPGDQIYVPRTPF